MTDESLNAKSSTGTRTRRQDVSPQSGMCPLCVKECKVLCEIGKSAFRGREVLYPLPEEYGTSTASSNKDYLLDWSHLQIMVDVLGAHGIEADPDKAIFPAVDITTNIGGIPLQVPIFIAGLGSTDVAKNHWDGLAQGCAISGTIMTVGENICGMDPSTKLDSNGKVTHSDDMKYRVEAYREFWDGEHGDIIIQTNVEDQRLGTDLYVLSDLEVNVIERKWGQGAKAIGGEVRISTLEKAKLLKDRGYVVLPDPEDPIVQESFKDGAFKTFERHSRVGMPTERGFVEDIEWLRENGAKKVFMKTGAYKPSVVAFTMKCASEAKIEALTFDGAGGGTGMSPIPMMQDCSTPTVYLQAQVLKCAEIMKRKGMHIPDLAMAGGFTMETQMFKSMAMSNLGDKPLIKAIATARSPLTAVMKAEYFTELAKSGGLPSEFRDLYGDKPQQYFIAYEELKHRFGDKFKNLSPGAIGMYTYFHDRIGVGLKQLMAGARKWNLSLLSRSDLASLSEKASTVTGIPTLDKLEQDAIESILG